MTPFTVSSDIDLGARITPFVVENGADVVIRAGAVPDSLEAPEMEGVAYQIDAKQFLLKVPNGLSFLVRNGREIIYQRAAHITEREVGLFLLGSAWSALCYQRDLLPLHASGIVIGNNVYAFTGPSGAGKSTLVSALSDRGFEFFTDDILIIDAAVEGSKVLCYSGQKDLKLWEDALALTDAQKGLPVREQNGFAKFFAKPQNQSLATVGDLTNLTILANSTERTSDADCSLTSLRGAASILELAGSVYRPHFARAIWGRKKLYLALEKVIQEVAVNKFHRPMAKSEFRRSLGFIEDWMDSRIAGSDSGDDGLMSRHQDKA